MTIVKLREEFHIDAPDINAKWYYNIAKLLDVAEAAQFSIMKMMPWPDDEFVMVPKYEFFKLRSMVATLETDNDK